MLKLRLIALALAGASLVSTATANTNVLIENFTNDPAADGWQVYGDTNLFHWDATNHNLAVTWDSSQSNSYFYHSLNPVLGEQDGFSLSFDLNLSNAVAGSDTFEIAVGFLNLADATGADFFRGSGYQSPNLVEFDYFPATTNYGASIDATMLDDANDFQFFYDNKSSLTNGVTYHVTIDHAISSSIVSGKVYTYDTNGVLQLYTSLPKSYLAGSFNDFFLNAISISSYSDVNGYGASVFAQGTVGNLVVTSVPRPIGKIAGSLNGTNGTIWQTQFSSRTNWSYTLQRSANLKSWSAVSPTISGNGAILMLQDTNAPADKAFYQVQASQ